MIAETAIALLMVITQPAPLDTPVSVGTYRITYYCQACNTPAGSTVTSTGRWIPGYSVASRDFPAGTLLIINGKEYRVDDTGCPSGTVDILRETEDGKCVCDLRSVSQEEVFVKEKGGEHESNY